MRCVWLFALGLGLLLALPPASSSALADGWPCGVVSARLVAESRHAVLARRPEVGERVQARYLACLRSRPRPVEVGVEGRRPGAEDLYIVEDWTRFAGAFVVVVPAYCLGGCGYSLRAFDLRRGRRVHDLIVRPSDGRMKRLFLTARGAIAYVSVSEERGITDVYAADTRGYRRVARAERSDLPVSSVRVRGNRLTWRLREDARSLVLR